MKVPLLAKLALFALVAAGVYFGVAWQLTPQALVMRAGEGRVVRAVSGSALVSPQIDTYILSPGSGFVAESSLRVGQEVRKGDKLATLDPGSLPFEMKATELEIEMLSQKLSKPLPDEIRLVNMRKQLADQEELLAKEHVAEDDVEDLRSQIAELAAKIDADKLDLDNELKIARNTLETQEDSLSRLTIYAPLDGHISEVIAYPGDLLSRGFEVARIISREHKVEVEVNQEDIGIIARETPVRMRFFAYGGQIFNATVEQILPGSNDSTQRFTVLVAMEDATLHLRPGMTGEASFIAGTTDGSVVIPRRALLGGRKVYIVEEGTVAIRDVRPGFVNLTHAEILEGIQPGDYVILEDLDLFNEGNAVKVKDITEDLDNPARGGA